MSAPIRANRDGHPCPPWCVTDHEKYSFHGSEPVRVEAPQFYRCSVRALLYCYSGANPLVEVAGQGVVRTPLDGAEDVADLIEGLAGATPAQHRELAAAIRQAAAVITEAGQ